MFDLWVLIVLRTFETFKKESMAVLRKKIVGHVFTVDYLISAVDGHQEALLEYVCPFAERGFTI